ncbi:molybdenum cofactor guanylyltransferase [Gloeocapsopsis dulcis]|uniref:Probable molybdenum cofactor guanylyltransferase n=1 Tax=Gloeocapsopsis dulcis AAB1 = 1H9 TaxID=1433147 RepID=A0A6N8FP23_9CHRO|nr:molybdenum cofactor guanylyltransferase [Gloeocapsopsis dulcis]MUL34879.1 molybdenum cofactor guanylyltransferase [Gloeocapsopsis dulcis AAB1 = 1H9]WNN90052.1 molybdenum cofactor guanylyltransferase [Gloeocapsopsis dulcis]
MAYNSNSNLKSPHSLSAIVLAGGKSSRMGQDKALILIHGVPLLQLICNIAGTLCNTVYVVTPTPEKYQHLSLKHCQFVREVPLPQENLSNPASTKITLPLPHGPLVGFAQGLAVVQTDWVLLLACDLPKLQAEVLQDWVRELENIPQDAIAALPRHAKGWEPLCGFYRRSCLPVLNDFIAQGGRSFQAWLAQNSVHILPLPAADMLFNCNTPDDLAFVIDDKQ